MRKMLSFDDVIMFSEVIVVLAFLLFHTFTVAELRSTENARCTITIPFVYEYPTLYLLHAIPDVRMLCRVYDPKRVSPINYTIFPR